MLHSLPLQRLAPQLQSSNRNRLQRLHPRRPRRLLSSPRRTSPRLMTDKVSSLMLMKSRTLRENAPTQERTVAAEVATKTAREEAVKAVDVAVAVEEATEKDAQEVTAVPEEEVVEMDATESETRLLMKMETQPLMVLRPVDTERAIRASPEREITHSTESLELAAERETTADRVAAMDGAEIRSRSQKPRMAKRSRVRSQPVMMETDRETTVTDKENVVPSVMPQRRKSPRRKLDSLSMTTKPRRRLATSRLLQEDSTRRLTRRVSRQTTRRSTAPRC